MAETNRKTEPAAAAKYLCDDKVVYLQPECILLVIFRQKIVWVVVGGMQAKTYTNIWYLV